MEIEYDKIETKEQLLTFIQALSQEDSASWENLSINEFLVALASWLQDAKGFYNNFNLETDLNIPSWQLFADALQAATVYE